TRLLATSGGILLYLLGQTTSGLSRLILKGGGIFLGMRGLINRDVKTLIGSEMSEDGRGIIDIRKSITIQAPVEQVYNLWENFDNFPRFMEHVKEVRNMGGGRNHWIVRGPAGMDVEFDAMVTEKVPNELIAWESVADSSVKHKGRVRFNRNNNRTRVQVWMTYIPPAGVLGHAVASLFGTDPKSAMDQDLARMKSLIEEGETTAHSEKVRKEDVMGGEERG
ncbi:MAG TPA: SRPBCC family protein, partial [Anaerolineaceae bacterium]|nr:SRPBCC family protein [Anaerolineaceae bacterium]